MEAFNHRDTSYKLDSFYEVNLEKILTDDDIDAFRYFYYLFRREAFVPDTSNRSFLDDMLSGSIRYTVSVSDDLGEKIYFGVGGTHQRIFRLSRKTILNDLLLPM